MKLLCVVVVVSSACGVTEPIESTTESAVTDRQGTDYQGTDYQGTDYQGTDYQGTDYQGTDYQGTDYQGSAYASVSLTGTALTVWKQLPDLTWEQRTATKVCLWSSNKTVVIGCTTYDLNVSPSPLAGAHLQAKFTKLVGGFKTTITGTIRIGSGPDDVEAVKHDTSLAMHPLDGTPAAVCQPAVTLPPTSPSSTSTCTNPRGCRSNCDLFTYKLYLVDGKVTVPFCQGGARAYALPGTWNATGQHATSTTRFTFACGNGTIAKCTRWGYRPWGAAKRNDGVSVATSEYHQACVRAATADYCANGRSFTKNGTLVDIYDYNGLGSSTVADVGFVPATSTWPVANNVFLWESTFDRYGATWLDHVRYEETSAQLEDPSFGCPSRWWTNGSDDVGANWNRYESVAPIQPIRVGVSNTTSCAHSEQTVGKWLDARCNQACIGLVSSYKPYCTDPHDSRGWDQGCVDMAATKCKAASNNPPMASHSECTTGGALEKFDSACTLAVCSQSPICCTSGSFAGWSSSCVSLANSMCKNGRENPFVGFCSSVLATVPTTSYAL